MQLTNQYYFFKKAIPHETCQRIIDLGLERIEQQLSEGKNVEAYTYGEMQKGAKPNATPQGEESIQTLKEKGVDNVYVRDSKVTWLNDRWLYDLVHPYVHEANFKAGWNWQWDYSESFQFTVYEPSGFYSWHKDGGSDTLAAYKRYLYGIHPELPKEDGKLPQGWVTTSAMVGKVRKISVTINLNEPGDYDGGNLMFDFGRHTDRDQFYECEEIRPQGSIIVFPSFLDHCVTPVTRGTRYSLVLWCLGKPFV